MVYFLYINVGSVQFDISCICTDKKHNIFSYHTMHYTCVRYLLSCPARNDRQMEKNAGWKWHIKPFFMAYLSRLPFVVFTYPEPAYFLIPISKETSSITCMTYITIKGCSSLYNTVCLYCMPILIITPV